MVHALASIKIILRCPFDVNCFGAVGEGQNKKERGLLFVLRIDRNAFLRFGDRANGAAVFARAAVDALVRIDDVLAVALGNCRHGAGVRASTARNAIVADNSRHVIHSFPLLILRSTS